MRQVFSTVFVLIVYALQLAVPTTVSAEGEFTADYDVLYEVSPQGITTVTQRIDLTNNYTNLYAKQYIITIDSLNISHIAATDRKGAITPVVSQIDGKTQITLSFNDAVVGVGNTLPFTLRYQHNDIAQKNGKIWEINIPGVSEDPNLGSYTVDLRVPESFGEPAYMSPPPTADGTWNRQQLIAGGVSIAYGDEQTFELELSYHLSNPQSNRVYTEVAIPPDTAYQRVNILSIQPQPVSMQRDVDGNWLARYDLDPKEEIDVTVDIVVSITLEPRASFISQQGDLEPYLDPTRYWQADSEAVLNLAQKYRTPEEIYEYVVGALSYAYERVNADTPVERKGAIAALEDPMGAVCMEFTDLFIAIARAAGIPARQLVGYAHTTNTRLRPLSLVADVLHAWPEYYDSTRARWVPVDPTWGNTTGGIDYFNKLDFNHIVFAINGTQDDFPYPAGSYKKEGKVTKDISVAFAPNTDIAPTQNDSPNTIVTQIEAPARMTAGFPVQASVVIKNESGKSVENAQVIIKGEPFELFITQMVDQIPPYSSIEIPLELHVKNALTSGRGTITATVNERATAYSVTIWPLYIPLFPVAVSVGIAVWGVRFFLLKRYAANQRRATNTS